MCSECGNRGVALPLLITILVLTLLKGGCPETFPVNVPPDASFEGKPAKGSPPLRVQFTDTSKPGTAPIHSWVWEFGDGATSTERNPSHLYYEPGGYNVSLTVTTAVTPASRTTARNYVVVTEATTVRQVGPGGGTIQAEGTRLAIPQGALDGEIIVGVAARDGSVPVDVSGGERLVSEVFSVAHDQEDFFVDVKSPMSLEITFISKMVPAADRNGLKLQILATQESGITIPVLGEVFGERLVAPIAGLPHRASYAVVYRPGVVIENIPIDEPTMKAATPTGYIWNTNAWRLCYTPAVLQALTALRVGTIDYQYPYDQRTYSTAENEISVSDLRNSVREAHNNSKVAGFISPALIPSQDDEFTIVLYNMNEPPRTDYSRVAEVTFATSPFGSIVVDPAQLIAISKKNPLPIAGEPIGLDADRMQELDFTNAFAQELFRAIFRGYAYPRFSELSAVDLGVTGSPRLTPFYQGFEDGIATFAGQLASALHASLASPGVPVELMARSLGPNEYATFTEPLFAPFSRTMPDYSYASQDFFFHAGLRFPGNVQGTSIPRVVALIADSYEGILELIRMREALPGVDGFSKAFSAAYVACDLALQKTLDTSLADVYWDYVLGRAYENGENNVIRPTDAVRTPFTFNEDRFNSKTAVARTLTKVNEPITVSFDTDPDVLLDVPPFSTRAILLSASSVSGDLMISVNAFDWVPDAAGNSMKVKAFKEGQDGVELNAQNAQITLTGLGTQGGFDRALVLFSNVTADRLYPVSLIASLRP
jgi:PKD repeat protein